MQHKAKGIVEDLKKDAAKDKAEKVEKTEHKKKHSHHQKEKKEDKEDKPEKKEKEQGGEIPEGGGPSSQISEALASR